MKMIKSLVFVAILASLSLTNQAQTNWSNKPIIHNIDKKYDNESLVLILDERNIKYEMDEKENTLLVRRSIHRIVKLVDEKGVESQNKQIVPTGYNSKITELKFRLIKSNGKVFEIKESDIKTSTNESGLLQYHIAFEDANIGDEIEFIIEEVTDFKPFSTEIMQFTIPVLKASFHLSCPLSLELECKSRNGFPNVTIDTAEGRRHYKAFMENIEALEDEKYADLSLLTQKIEYKLIGSSYDPGRLYTWNDFTLNQYKYIYTINDKERKALAKFLKNNGIDATEAEDIKIKKLEQVLKTKVVLNDELDDIKYKDIDFILEKMTTYNRAYIRLWANALELLNVKHEVGLVANKFEYDLDEKFENWYALETYVIYINNSKNYILPIYETLRYPALTPHTEGAKGVFCKRISAGSIISATSNFRTLPTSPYENNAHNLDVKIELDESFNPKVNIKNYFTGLSANGVREMATYIKKEDEKELIKSLVDFINNDNEIINYDFTNRGVDYYATNAPLIITANINASSLIEKAGSKYILKIGDVIGRQEELYQAHKRQQPISMPFSHVLKREIVVNIPKGYRILDLEKLNKNINTPDKYGFISKYKVEQDKLIINIEEYYINSKYEARDYDSFRDVINAAADFNKISLVFDKI